METKPYPVIDVVATGHNIRRLRMMRGLSVKDLQNYFGFNDPRAIYKWQSGESLPTVDNLYALSRILGVSMDQILVPVITELHTNNEQQGKTCCSKHLWSGAAILPLSHPKPTAVIVRSGRPDHTQSMVSTLFAPRSL